MPRQPFDIGSKYLVQHQARGLLLIGGAKGVRSVKALQAEMVQQRQLPDGLLEIYFEKQKRPDHVLIEVATYPEKRALDQALDDLTLARSHLKGQLPELLMLVLYQRGKFRITGSHAIQSRLGWAKLTCDWRVVEVWTLPAEELLALADVGVVPLATLARYDGPPETLLERCREKIETEARGTDRADLLAVSQVLAALRFPQRELLDLLGGRKVMAESWVIQEQRAGVWHEAILDTLQARFETVPGDVRRLLGETSDEKKLKKLHRAAVSCASVDDFKERLLG